ncbi:outer membrane beta-barrel protein [Mucilaginibacter sp. CSA2-8R]|uniref:outer membrane beta-barrel protein n=1 Tax=Mucilaginibacter sp. CSA2-8R TaxID=3141542 RepID=UPI00315DFBB9
MKYILTVILSCFICGLVSAQTNYHINGSVADTISNVKLHNTSIMVLNAKDSTLRKFTRAAADGTFSINNLGKGKFILVASYPKYADYVENFALDSVHTSYNFGRLSLILKSKLLEGVIVKGTRAAIKLKGDTTEFNASSFTVQPNAKVEDLLKQLPGIQVDKDGKITAQGQAVPKVLVDGEEFFGDDPTLVTKNIRADMVDKVQLYDKASDQAAFTGVDDGNKTKTINIKLKEDKKNGYFGKVDAGIGTKKFYQEQVAFNKFIGKKKFSAYGTLANTGKTGLGWQDANKFGTSGNNIEVVDGGINISGGNDELEGWNGRFDGQGIPTARTGGVHYDDKWNADKQTINANYKIGSLGVTGSSNQQSQNSLSTGLIRSNTNQNFNNYIFRQKVDGTLVIKLDSTSNLKISADATFKHSNSQSDNAASSVRGDSSLINTNNRRLDNKGDEQTFNFSAFYNKKFKKAGRTVSFLVTQSVDENKNKGNLLSEIKYYNEKSSLDSARVVDQFKDNNIQTSIFNTNLTYSEPFSKTFSLIANYGVGISNSTADRRSYNQSTPGNYDVLVPSLSNNYRLDQFTNQGGAVFNYKKDKTTFNFGTKVALVNFKQLNKFTDNEFDRNFINWNPQLLYMYRFTQQKWFRFNYNGSTRQPTIDQIQPIIINTDPLNVTLGNPDLKPSFNNRFSFSYSSYKVLTNRSIWLSASYNVTSNPIVSNVTTDPKTGFTTNRYVNLPGQSTSSYSAYGDVGMKLKFLFNVEGGIGLNTNGSTYFNMVNNALNRTRSNSYGINATLRRYIEKKLDFYVSGGPTYTLGESSLQPGINNNGSGFTINHDVNVYLPGKLQIGFDGGYEYRAPTQSFNQSFSRYLLNGYINKSLVKDESLKIRLTVNDLLNQNRGFDRRSSGSFLTQNTYTTIRRYFMFSIVYDFNKMGGAPPKK